MSELLDKLDSDLEKVFFSSEGFSIPVVFQNGLALYGIFDNAYQAVIAEGITPVSSVQPMLTVNTNDLTVDVHNELLTVNGSQYRVQDVQPDGTGVTVLMLELQ